MVNLALLVGDALLVRDALLVCDALLLLFLAWLLFFIQKILVGVVIPSPMLVDSLGGA